MLSNDTRVQIENITGGIILEGSENTLTTARNLLCRSFRASKTVKKEFESQSIIKEEQRQAIELFASSENLWITSLPDQDRYLTRGGESQVYLDYDSKYVIKINDCGYYTTWLDFFNSLLLHNLIFKNTAYELLGFFNDSQNLHAALRQPFVTSDADVRLDDIKSLLEHNGFENTRRQDYIHRELGLILEDMHDENVIVNSHTLFFIDTVFYIVEPEYLQEQQPI